MNAPRAPEIFSAKTRQHKRLRALRHFSDHEFLHRRSAEDVVDRLETVLKHFEQALFYGSAGKILSESLTEKADVGQIILADEIVSSAETITAPPDQLPFEDQTFDLVVSTMTLHAVSDVPAALSEARRLLKPDGLFIAVFPGEETLTELRQSLRQAETELLDRVSPRIAPFIAIKDAGALLQRAGFAMPVSDVDRVQIDYSDPVSLFRDLRGAGETCHLAKAPKGALRRDLLAKTIATYRDLFPASNHGVLATVDLITVTGWAPHPKQPKALAPGSAKASMAKAISTFQQTDEN